MGHILCEAFTSPQVYKAFRNGVQVVAVKIFTDQVPGENQARYAEAFRREIFILRSCHDRNIVQFLGACLQVGSLPNLNLAVSLLAAFLTPLDSIYRVVGGIISMIFSHLSWPHALLFHAWQPPAQL